MIGKTVSHYLILEEIGRGGMGVVYKAVDTKLKRTVALKFLPPELTRDPEAKKRFIHEAQAAAVLEHTNICNIYEIDETEDGQTFIAMAYYEGETLKDKIKRSPLKIEEALDIAIQITDGLKEAHEKGIIHRDIKSANIMITSKGQTEILDFGLAKLSRKTKLTKTGTTLGTVAYMSPEQSRGEKVDHRSDIWSVGVILYEMVTGQLPYQGEYDQAVMYSILNEDPEPVTALRTGIPVEFESIINKCLDKDPANRYQHTSELGVDLKRLQKILKAGGSRVKPVSSPGSKKTRRIIATAIAACVLITGATYLYFKVRSGPEQPGGRLTTETEWENSIAVLPFVDMSPQKDQEYFCDGITDDLIGRLCRIEGLKVISRTSVMLYKNTKKDIKEIGRELGVVTVLEGSIQKEKDNIRINAQLINVVDRFHLWSDIYNRKLDSVFEVQDEVSQAIAGALKVKFTPEILEALKTTQPENVEAYNYYLRGKYLINSKYAISNQEADFHAALRMFNKAVVIDPNYTLAFVGLAWAYGHHSFRTGNKNDYEQSLKYCEIAYELNQNLAETNVAQAYIYEAGGDKDKAYQFYEKAMKMGPKSSEIYFMVGAFHQNLGLYHQAIPYYYRSTELDPLYPSSHQNLAECYWGIGEFEKAAIYYEKLLEISQSHVRYLLYYAGIKIKMKEYDKAEEILAQVEKSDPDSSSLIYRDPDYTDLSYCKALLLAVKGEKKKALSLYKGRSSRYIYSILGMKNEAIKDLNDRIKKGEYFSHYLILRNNPLYDNLRDDPRFQEILERQKKIYEEKLEKYGDL